MIFNQSSLFYQLNW